MKRRQPHPTLLLLAALGSSTSSCSKRSSSSDGAPAQTDTDAHAHTDLGAAPDPDAPVSEVAPSGDTAAPRPDRQQVLRDLVRVVIQPAYLDLRSRADSLAAALSALEKMPDAPGLAASRQAWRETRTAWRRCAAFAIGPADDLAITGGIIDEPTNGTRLETLLAGPTPLDTTALLSLPAAVRGLLAVEYLLFDPALPDPALLARFTGDAGRRRATFLTLLGAELAIKLTTIAELWSTRFGSEVGEAGRGSTAYARERDAYDALLNKALAVVDRTIDTLRTATGGNTAISIPPPTTVRSDHVLADLEADLQGFEDLYLARRGSATGLALADVVRDMNAPADTQMRQALAGARAALAQVPRPVSSAGATSPAVTQAITALRAVKAALATGIFGALGASVGFSDNDGD